MISCIRALVECESPSGKVTALNNTADCAGLVARSSLRYVLSDDLTRLCADLAYSKGAGRNAHASRTPQRVHWKGNARREVPARVSFPEPALSDWLLALSSTRE